jgi:hypothetical protein
MKEFWIDSDVLIWSKNNAFRFLAPHAAHFWHVLERGFQEGVLKLTRRNFKEMLEGRDQKDLLVKWLQTQRERAPKSINVSASIEVQSFAKKIGAYVFSNSQFLPVWQNEFAKGADAWLIAHAAVNDATVVSRETALTPEAKKPKIPNLCEHFDVKHVNMFDMLDQLEAAIAEASTFRLEG